MSTGSPLICTLGVEMASSGRLSHELVHTGTALVDGAPGGEAGDGGALGATAQPSVAPLPSMSTTGQVDEAQLADPVPSATHW